MDISNLDINITAICITALIAVIGIALAILFGLRGFGDKFTRAKEEVVRELANIKQKIVKVEVISENILVLTRATSLGQTGTKEVYLTYFGKIMISAELGTTETTYTVDVEKGTINDIIIIKVGKLTGLAQEEVRLFGKETMVFSLGPKKLLMSVPSVDPKLCTQYMNFFLKWLKEEYEKAVESKEFQKSDFEEGIEV